MTNGKLENKIQGNSVIFFPNYDENNIITLLLRNPPENISEVRQETGLNQQLIRKASRVGHVVAFAWE